MQDIRFMRDAGGARVAYAVVGDGPLLVCPAWWVSHVERDWEHPGFRRFFSRLAEGFRVVRYDRPGTGLSDRDVPARTQAAEVQLLAMLANALGDDPFSIFAVSCAGPVALAYAATHQERVRRLCLYGSHAHWARIATPDPRGARVELVEAGLPEATVSLEPVDGLLERRALEPGGPELRRAAARDQACVLEHLSDGTISAAETAAPAPVGEDYEPGRALGHV